MMQLPVELVTCGIFQVFQSGECVQVTGLSVNIMGHNYKGNFSQSLMNYYKHEISNEFTVKFSYSGLGQVKVLFSICSNFLSERCMYCAKTLLPLLYMHDFNLIPVGHKWHPKWGITQNNWVIPSCFALVKTSKMLIWCWFRRPNLISSTVITHLIHVDPASLLLLYDVPSFRMCVWCPRQQQFNKKG